MYISAISPGAMMREKSECGLGCAGAVAFTWSDVLPREDRVQLSIVGKGGKVRQVLLPEIVSRCVLSLRGDAGNNDPVFVSRRGGRRLRERTVHAMVKRAAAKAGLPSGVSPHWLRHAHGPHAIDRGVSPPEVQATLGHGNISTTSGYLHARPDTPTPIMDKAMWFANGCNSVHLFL
jgi:site-specific recombinase XerD